MFEMDEISDSELDNILGGLSIDDEMLDES